jgi:hypothetical protein
VGTAHAGQHLAHDRVQTGRWEASDFVLAIDGHQAAVDAGGFEAAVGLIGDV